MGHASVSNLAERTVNSRFQYSAGLVCKHRGRCSQSRLAVHVVSVVRWWLTPLSCQLQGHEVPRIGQTSEPSDNSSACLEWYPVWEHSRDHSNEAKYKSWCLSMIWRLIAHGQKKK